MASDSLPPSLPTPQPGLADAAAALLAIADDNGLGHLRAVALDWIVHHYDAVARTGVLGLLERTQVISQCASCCHCATIVLQQCRSATPAVRPAHPSPESYHNLSREQVALVAEEACRLHAAMIK